MHNQIHTLTLQLEERTNEGFAYFNRCSFECLFSNDTVKATPLWLSTDKQHNLTHIPQILWPLNNPSLEIIYSSHHKHGVFEFSKEENWHPVLSELKQTDIPAVRPQGPTARDSGSRAVQQSHICFRRQLATLQIHNTTGRPQSDTDTHWSYITGAFLVCSHSVYSHFFIIWKSDFCSRLHAPAHVSSLPTCVCANELRGSL